MINGELIGDTALVARFDKMSVNVLVKLRAAISEQTFRLSRFVQLDKLNKGKGATWSIAGQALSRRTGTLAASVARGTGVVETSAGVVGTVGLGGADLKVAKYGAVHEYGFKGEVKIAAFRRKDGFAVRAHSRKVNLPDRKWLRGSLAARKEDIIKAMGEAVTEGLKGGGV